MASIIPNEHSSLDFNMDPPPQSHYEGFGDLPINSVANSPTMKMDGPATYVSPESRTGESTVSLKQENVNGDSQSSPYSSHKQSTESDLTRGTETYASSPAAASSYPPQPNQSHHHAHSSYHQYYQHYPHGHTPYYYPPGPYYPPPPAHGGHQPYASTGHHPHYYAHYPPPPGYYPPPHYSHYYSQHPPAASSAAESTHRSKSAKVSTSPTTVASTKESSSSTSPTSTSSSSTKSTKGPYSAFSSSKNIPPKTVGLSSTTYKSTQKPKPSLSSTKNKRKQPPAPDSNAIFRLNAKRSKQLAASSKAAAAAIAAKRAESKVKAQSELSKTVLERRSRKNAQSRMRASKLKQRIADVQKKNPEDRTPEEVAILSVFEERRQRKNGRSRERAMERKKEYDRISSLPEHLWSTREKNFIQETIVAKFKKNEGDRMRRKKLKGENDESYGSDSLSGDWDSSTCRSSVSVSKKLPDVSKKSSDQNGIPDYIESTNDNTDTGYTSESGEKSSFFPTKDAPLTPLSQKEAYSLLESTPTNFFGTATPDRKGYFSPNLIFPSPSINRRDISANMDSIDFDSLVLPTDGTSILDSSMAIDDEVIYSPHLNPPTINEGGFQTTAQHAIPQLNSSGRLSPLNLPRRNRPSENFMKLGKINQPCPETESHEFPYSSCGDDMSGDHSNVASKAIAISFSVDTA